MPSVGQYKRYISQGETKIAKLKDALANASGSKKSEIKDLLNVTTAKVKEHKAALKSAPVGKSAVKTAGKTSVAKKVVAKKAAPVAVAAPLKSAAPAPSLSQFKKLEAQVADLACKLEMLCEKVSGCTTQTSSCSSNEENTES